MLLEEQKRQLRFLIVIAAVICAVVIGYNAFYVPDAPLSEPVVQSDLTSVSSSVGKHTASRSTASAARSTGEKVNINTATAGELSEKLSGIGDNLAERIVAYRQKNGLFRSVEALKNVPGIGDKKYEEIQPYLTVD